MITRHAESRPARALTAKAIFAALAILLAAWALPANAFAEDQHVITVQATAVTVSGEKLDAERAQLLVEAKPEESHAHDGAPRDYIQYTVNDGGRVWICGNSTRSNYLREIVVTDSEGNVLATWKGGPENTGVGDKFDIQTIPWEIKSADGTVLAKVGKKGQESGSRIDMSLSEIKASLTFTYNYVVADPYPITFQADGQTVATYERWYFDIYGEAPAAPAKGGYVFVGWRDQAGNPYNPSSYVYEAKSYTAIYEPAYTVAWDLAGGTLGGSDAIPDSEVAFDNAIPLPTATPYREGWTFKGWSLAGESVPIADGTTYAELAKDQAVTEITLIALWEPIQSPKPGDSAEPPVPDANAETEPAALPATDDPSRMVAAGLIATGTATLGISTALRKRFSR